MTLRRNEKVDGAVKSICELEYRFNHGYGYPWVFDEVGFTGFSKQSVYSVTSRLIRLKACHSGDISLVVDGGENFYLWVRHNGLVLFDRSNECTGNPSHRNTHRVILPP